jgi:hypothetical protein
LEAPGVAIGSLAVEEQGQPFGMGEIAPVLLRFELDEGLGHAVELERAQLVEGYPVRSQPATERRSAVPEPRQWLNGGRPTARGAAFGSASRDSPAVPRL